MAIILLIFIYTKYGTNWKAFRNTLLSLKSIDYFPVSPDDENFLFGLKNLKLDNFPDKIEQFEGVSSVEDDVVSYICSARFSPYLDEEKDCLGSITGIYLKKDGERSLENSGKVNIRAKKVYKKNLLIPDQTYYNAIRTPTMFFEVIPTGRKDIIIIQNKFLFTEIGKLPSGMIEVTDGLTPEFQKLFLVSTTGEPSKCQISADIQEILSEVVSVKFLQFKTQWLYALRISPEGWCISSSFMLKEEHIFAMVELADKLRPLLF